MKFSETCLTVPATWKVDADALRSALNWWAGWYRDGYRLTLADDQYQCERAMMPWCRLEAFGRFGRFPKPAPLDIPDAMLDGMEKHDPCLRLLLDQASPEKLTPYFSHLLEKAYELDPIEDWAGQNRLRVQGLGTQGGYFLIYYGRRREATDPASRRKLATAPPILARYKPLVIE